MAMPSLLMFGSVLGRSNCSPDEELPGRVDFEDPHLVGAAVVAPRPEVADLAVELEAHHSGVAARDGGDSGEAAAHVIERVGVDDAAALDADEEEPLAVVRILQGL